MPGGIDFIYPKENLLLYKDISEKGLILSEKPMFTEPDAIDFKTRNRIVAGLSVATCVMEATIKSGSLMTARLALEYDREVFAVPGQPADPRSRGTNQLLYNGAHMLTAINDVLEVLNSNINLIHTDHTVREDFIEVHINIDDITDEMRQTVKNSLSYEPVTIEALHTYTQVNIRFLHLILLEFELLQEIERHASNKFALPIRF
jgi:DNA processing protein